MELQEVKQFVKSQIDEMPLPQGDLSTQARSYTLRTESGSWLGQIILTSDGLFSGLTDWGNFSFAWRSFGEGDFRNFIAGLDVEYFGGKMYQGMQYIASGKMMQKNCKRFAEKILPELQRVLKEEIEKEKTEVFELMNRLNDIDTKTKEGKYLMAAIAKISTESQTDKEPDQIVSQLTPLVNHMYNVH